ncbi:DNA polymerase II small subunit [archaeon]|nr:DNA polymerase II small subunit [archaeon]
MTLVDRFKDEGYLVSPGIAGSFKGDVDGFISFVKHHQPGINVIDKGVLDAFNSFLKGGFSSNVRVLCNYELDNVSRDLSTWLGFYNKRYDLLSSSLSKRGELKSVVSINRVDRLINRNEFSLVGLVSDLRETNSGNFIIELEDPSGTITLLVSKSSPAFGLVRELVPDEVIGVNVRKNGRWNFVDTIIFPEVPVSDNKSCDDDSTAVFISDTHIGSKDFLPDEFQRFIDWLNGEWGSKAEKQLASKVKYLFFAGDLVDGVGIYPGQEDELVIKDVNKQYEAVAGYLKQVPEHIKVILSPGNHDACRLSLPQPPLSNEFTKPLSLPNVTFVSNPAVVNINSGPGFPGYDVLVYHGNSFDYYLSNVPRLREAGYDRPELIMEFLLRKRHLSPSHSASLIAPSINDDFLLINKVPDVFISGHVHHSGYGVYKGVSLLNCSCFQAPTDFMKRLGMHPKPGKIPVMSLKNKKVKIIDFES